MPTRVHLQQQKNTYLYTHLVTWSTARCSSVWHKENKPYANASNKNQHQKQSCVYDNVILFHDLPILVVCVLVCYALFVQSLKNLNIATCYANIWFWYSRVRCGQIKNQKRCDCEHHLRMFDHTTFICSNVYVCQITIILIHIY